MIDVTTSKSSSHSPTKPQSAMSPFRDSRPTFSNQGDERLGQYVLPESKGSLDILNYYILKSAVGRGQFGSVKLAIHKTGSKKRKFAVKIVPKEKVKTNFQMLRRELQYLKILDHPNIIKIYEVFEDAKNVNIVMDYLSGGELFDRLEKKARFPEREAALLMYSLFHSISHMHRRGISHRDLKPENFLYETKREEAEIKVIDFGLANKFDVLNNEMHTMVGTPYYVAPEVLRKNYGKECDLWSLGVIMYAVLAGFPPFNGDTNQEIQRKILKGDYHFNHVEWEPVSKDAKNLIKSLLNLEPAKRPPAAEVLNHPWFAIIQDVAQKPLDETIGRRIKSFRAGGKLRREVLKVLCQFVPNEEIRTVNAAFRVLDKAHIGYIATEDLETALRLIDPTTPFDLRQPLTDMELFEGMIPYTDFLLMALNPEAYTQPDVLESAFKHFDSTDKSFITLEDVRKVFTKSNKVVMDDDLTRLIGEYDLNGDGKLDLEEFEKMVIQATPRSVAVARK